MQASTSGARHIADSRNWLAWQDELERRSLVQAAADARLHSIGRATLCQLAAAHDGAEPAAWLEHFLGRIQA